MYEVSKVLQRFLIVSRSPHHPFLGSTQHMEDFVQFLRSSGCEVHYLCLCPPTRAEPGASAIHTFYFAEASETVAGPFDAPVHEQERRLVERVCRRIAPSVVIADYSWMNDIFESAYFKENRSVKKVSFVHDLRVRIMPSYVTMGLIKPEQNPWTNTMEGTLLAKADLLLTLNEDDKRLAQELAPCARVLRMGMSVSPQFVDLTKAIPGRCIYVASNLQENLFAVMWLLRFAWPKVVAAVPTASLEICGGIGDMLAQLSHTDPTFVGNLSKLNVLVRGRVESLTEHYAAAQIAMVPHWMAGGIKIKHLEALAHALAVVCTTVGADGLPEAIDKSSFTAEMPDPFAEHTIRLLKRPAALQEARSHARDLSLKLKPEHVYRELATWLHDQES